MSDKNKKESKPKEEDCEKLKSEDTKKEEKCAKDKPAGKKTRTSKMTFGEAIDKLLGDNQ